jgi:hypothetical protein
MCFSARLPLADRTGAIASPGPSSLLPLFTEVPRSSSVLGSSGASLVL